MKFKIQQNPCCEAYPFCNCDRALSVPTVTVGSTTYLVSKALLKRIKAACKIAKLDWKPIAARPSTAEAFCEHVERLSKAEAQ